MTIAGNIRAVVASAGISAVSLRYGYALHGNGSRSLFDPGIIESERRNLAGRVTFLASRYEDGSILIFQWHPVNGASYKEG